MKHWILGSQDEIEAGLAADRARIAAGQYNVIEAVKPSPEELAEWKADLAEVGKVWRDHALAHPEAREIVHERLSGLLEITTLGCEAVPDPVYTLEDGSVIGVTEYEPMKRSA